MTSRIVNSGVRKTPRFTNLSTQNVVFNDVAPQTGFTVNAGALRGRGVLWAERAPGDCVVYTDRNGIDHDLCAGGGTSIQVRDEGIILGTFDTLNIVGDLIEATDAGGSITDITVLTPNLFQVLTVGNDAGGLNIENLGTLNFDTTPVKGIEIGTDIGSATTTQETQIAIGRNTSSSGVSGIVIGPTSSITATGTNNGNIAMGSGVTVFGVNTYEAVAIGNTSSSSGVGTISIGSGSGGTGLTSVAIGFLATTSSNYAIAIGSTASASGTDSVSIGHLASITATGVNNSNISIGDGSTVSGLNTYSTVVIGDAATSNKANSIAIGAGSDNRAVGGITIGDGAYNFATALNSVAIGSGAKAYNQNSVCIGNGSVALAANNIILGASNTPANATNIVAIGTSITCNGGSSIGILGSPLGGLGNIAIGSGSSTGVGTGQNNLAIGVNATTDGDNNCLAVGANTTANGIESTAIGNGTSATALNAIAIGSTCTTSGRASIAIGEQATCAFDYSIVLSTGTIAATASGQLTVALNGFGLRTQFFTDVAAGAIVDYLIVDINGNPRKIPLHALA